MSIPRIFAHQSEQDLYEKIVAEATNTDYVLGAFLMKAAFHGRHIDPDQVAPIYLIQAYHINRDLAKEFQGFIP